ncbi:hypothetical protein [uncultured Campylobacter sp.]|uniref:hypothetical protein n=1 Tax=uncultured Campylobacter sp. TaxID=218934 RepID=UPI00261747F0|nr:hypothetical protein [uncultured Campylobacter sp.]
MPYIHLLMPLSDFIPYIASILADCGGTVYVQKSGGAYSAVKIDAGGRRNLSDRRQSFKFFISSEPPQEPELPAKVFYDDMYRSIIEGTGGRETQEAVEMIALRLVAKNPGAAIRKIFSAIKNKLENDEAIGRGLSCGASFYKDYFYAKRCVDGKILKFDLNNDKLPNITTP